MAHSSLLNESLFPCSGISIVSSMVQGEEEALGRMVDVSDNASRRSVQEYVHSQKVQQSGYFTALLNSSCICEAEKRELNVNSTTSLKAPTSSFSCETASMDNKHTKMNPFTNKCGYREALFTEESTFNEDTDLERLWAELGIPIDEQDAVRAYFSMEKQNTRRYNCYISKVKELAGYRRIYISLTLLYERLTVELNSVLCNIIGRDILSTERKNPESILALLNLYRLLAMALMALTELARAVCGIPVSLPYLNAREVRSATLTQQLLSARLLSPERVHALLSINGRTIELASVEKFFLECETWHCAGIAEHALLIACIPDPLMETIDTSLAEAFAWYFHLITSTTETLFDEMESLLESWTKRLNLPEVSVSVLVTLSSNFQLEHYVLMVLEEERAITNLEMQLDEMQFRNPDGVFFTIPICEGANCHTTTAPCSSSELDAPNAPLLGHSSALRDSL